MPVRATCGNGFKCALQKDRAVVLPDVLIGVIKNADPSLYSQIYRNIHNVTSFCCNDSRVPKGCAPVLQYAKEEFSRFIKFRYLPNQWWISIVKFVVAVNRCNFCNTRARAIVTLIVSDLSIALFLKYASLSRQRQIVGCLMRVLRLFVSN